MKKSDAVKKIEDALYSHYYEGICPDGDYILSIVEDLGMLEPLTDEQLNHLSPMDFSWEPEND